jgi:hypothetical protein
MMIILIFSLLMGCSLFEQCALWVFDVEHRERISHAQWKQIDEACSAKATKEQILEIAKPRKIGSRRKMGDDNEWEYAVIANDGSTDWKRVGFGMDKNGDVICSW